MLDFYELYRMMIEIGAHENLEVLSAPAQRHTNRLTTGQEDLRLSRTPRPVSDR